ncbi:iron-containing alcohol dehydrogenase [Gracilibacillus salitolerans]|uniref:Iron-containing alcohol dehydrogenase n=1 Tax=Gracilibacillus salitolerans TaxID=2663022 RepID=A0A5Q2TR19_9BACI|nr:iron-containing alcohol dehydrogenase [Gracilibacillus salitolerans]QGH36170.1 iron-containing alcohol dehydrogenase [Gracilibacillus salitolerans]
MNNIFSFRMPKCLYYGEDSFGLVGEQVKKYGHKCLLISDKVMDNLGHVNQCIQFLKQSSVNCMTYLGVNSEPTDRHVEEALKLFRDENCDVIVSLGGGSCIDTGKAVAVLAEHDGDVVDYFESKKQMNHSTIPFIALPTTAGTGSEVTDVTVITNTKNDVKMMIKDPALTPSVAIVDPILTYTLPSHITASTGIDALCHAIEAYISRLSHPMTDNLALSAIRLISQNIRLSYNNEDPKAKGKMALASMQAGVAFSNASVCLVHGMSRPIGALFHVPHGVSNAMILPAILYFSKESCIEKMAIIGRIFNRDLEQVSDVVAADSAVEEIRKLCAELNIPNMKDWGIEMTRFKQFVCKMADDALASGSPDNNPKVPSKEEIIELYETCYSYHFM